MTHASKPRLAGLDLLRLAAIFLVLGRHIPSPPDGYPLAGRLIFGVWQRGGWVGVDLFFVLSGFLVSGLLFTEYRIRERISILRFYIRRGWKIYPPFFVLIFVTVIANIAAGRSIDGWELISELLFLQSYAPGLWNHTWSLAVEEHFYLLLPIVLVPVLGIRRQTSVAHRRIILLGACIAISALAMRLVNWQAHESYSYMTHVFATHLRIDSLFLGVVISYLYHFHSNHFIQMLSPRRQFLVIVGGALLTPAFLFQLETTPFIYTLGLTLFSIGSGMLLIGVLLSRTWTSWPVRVGSFLGAHSYSIYLWHMPVAIWGIPLVERGLGFPVGFGARTALFIGGSIAIGILAAKLVEFPALRLRDRWFPARDEGAVGAVSDRRVQASGC